MIFMGKEKIALFHPWLKSRGGAEKLVLEILKKSKHEIDIYTWVYDKEKTFSEFKDYDIKIIAPKFAEKLSRKNILRGFLFPLGLLKKIPLKKYDKFLISTSGLAEFIVFRNRIKGKTYAYVCTPLREATKNIVKWNLKNRHKGFLKKIVYLSAVKIYLLFEKLAWKRIDKIAFISELSQGRGIERKLIKKEDSRIIYPTVDFSRFEKLKSKSGEKTFVYYSRLNPPKRQDLLIESWKGFVKEYPSYNLSIIGSIDNPEYFEKLKKLAKETKNVSIKTNVPNKELEEIISKSNAGIFLGYEEDFGIVPFEILCARKPLIAVDVGGYVDLIKNNKHFFTIKEKHSKEEMVEEIKKALENFVNSKIDKKFEKIKVNNFGKELNEFLDS